MSKTVQVDFALGEHVTITATDTPGEVKGIHAYATGVTKYEVHYTNDSGLLQSNQYTADQLEADA